jgi:hypothetical protein
MDGRPGYSTMVGCLLLPRQHPYGRGAGEPGSRARTRTPYTHPHDQIEQSRKSRLDATNQPTEPVAASAINRR